MKVEQETVKRKYHKKSLNLGHLCQHQINELKDLKLDNNKDIVLPPLHILEKRLDEVMRWSERRLGSIEHLRVQNIILSVQELLRHVCNNKVSTPDLSQPHESLFQDGVEENGEYYYQFLPEALWNLFLPLLEHIRVKSEENANFFYFSSVAMK